ncbi:MAG TPA: LysR family transcriptional regulator [Marinobacterium sp.]|nr:LysR family transcriptional regulator [Marinobacterium sp.]
MKQYSLDELSAFIAVVDSGSFVRAAKRLKTSSASISRKVSALEGALGVSLLQRTTRSVNLTEAGEQYYRDVQHIFDALNEAQERITESSQLIAGELRLAAPMSFGLEIIAPLLPQLLQLHPNLSIDLHLEDRQTDLLSNGIDLAIRIGALSDSSLVATKLGEIEFGYFASPCYLKRHGLPLALEDLTSHQCLHYSLISRSSEWGSAGHTISTTGRFSANNGEALCEAAVQGLGIVALPHFIVRRAVESGELQQILKQYPSRRETVYAVRTSRSYTPRKVREVITFFSNAFSEALGPVTR